MSDQVISAIAPLRHTDTSSEFGLDVPGLSGWRLSKGGRQSAGNIVLSGDGDPGEGRARSCEALPPENSNESHFTGYLQGRKRGRTPAVRKWFEYPCHFLSGLSAR